MTDAPLKEHAGKIWAELPPNAREVLGHLFLHGPLYDGSLSSKTGRDTLLEQTLIERGFGWQWLTRLGVIVAVHADAGQFFSGAWRRKQISN